jgi:ribonuclease Z
LSRFTVKILGSSSATPTSARNPSAQLVNCDEKLILIDCGEGTQIQLRRMKVKLNRINYILISHLHGDHFFGLIGLISTMNLYGRTEELMVYSPKGMMEIIEIQLLASQTVLQFPLKFNVIDPNEGFIELFEEKSFNVFSFPLVHRIETCGFLIREKDRPLKLRKERIESLDIPLDKFLEIKNGANYLQPDGKIIPNSHLTYPPVKPRSYAYCSDTRYCEDIVEYLMNVDLLYHESTFMQSEYEIAHEKYHSTAVEAAKIAKLANAGKLLLGHYSARYKDLLPLLEEARAIFPESFLSFEGMNIDIEVREQNINRE